MIIQAGAINTTALVVPDLYVQIVPPAQLTLNGVPTNTIGVVGTATWGPVAKATIVGTMAQYAQIFGAVQARLNDMGTAVAVAVQQGATSFKCVRVTDGTDVAATGTLLTSCLTITSLYTGTLGNSTTVTVVAGTKASSFAIVIAIPGLVPEKFDNITGTGNAFWVAAAAAINSGSNPLRGPSQLVTATAGAGTTAASAGTAVTLSSGTDGVATITSAVMVGVDTIPRKGMYCLRSQGCSIGMLADVFDSTQWTTIDALGLAEGIYMIQVGPSGDTISNAVTVKGTAGLDDYSSKLLFGDWVYWNDQANGVLRLVSPQGFVAGRLANLSPEQSSLNKPLYGVVATQKSGLPGSPQFGTYTYADKQALFGAGIDVIMNPVPGGNYWGVGLGHNSSSDATRSGDNYTRMTNYIAATLNAGMGLYVGRVINSSLFANIRGTLLAFLQNLLQQGLLGTLDGSLPFSVMCDITNNPLTRTSLGYVQADNQIQYQAINEKFVCNIQGGQTVTVTQASTGVTR